MGVLTADSFKYDCCNCGTPTLIGREEFMGLCEVGGKIDSDYRCSDCADKAKAKDEADKFGGYEDLARGLHHLLGWGVLRVSAGDGYAQLHCDIPDRDESAKISDTPSQTPKQALDAAIFAAVEQFEADTGLEIGDIDLDREYRHVTFSVITRSMVTR